MEMLLLFVVNKTQQEGDVDVLVFWMCVAIAPPTPSPPGSEPLRTSAHAACGRKLVSGLQNELHSKASSHNSGHHKCTGRPKASPHSVTCSRPSRPRPHHHLITHSSASLPPRCLIPTPSTSYITPPFQPSRSQAAGRRKHFGCGRAVQRGPVTS